MVQTADAIVFKGEDFLEWEELQEDKHEYIQGEIFAMGRARREHVVVSLNVASVLNQQLKGKPYQTYIADMKLRVEQVNAFFYPDVMVSCDQDDQKAEQYLSNPSLIIEVLSDSTEAFDRGNKFSAYRKLQSLKEYALIDIKALRIECFRRTEDNDWLLHISENQESCDFSSLNIFIALADIFEDVN
ncbi:MAG: Uma2 family endonuclease [Methylococcaceae bacterium]|nr:Uma2 family endonuclease [Methylococcaceae bacterium]